jgi:hypothetical protein
VAETLWQRHCSRDTVAETLWQRHCGRDTVAETLWQRHCSRDTVAETLWQRHCGRDTVAETLSHNNKGRCVSWQLKAVLQYSIQSLRHFIQQSHIETYWALVSLTGFYNSNQGVCCLCFASLSPYLMTCVLCTLQP